MKTIDDSTLREFVAALFVAAGMNSRDGLTVSDCLVEANLRGVDTHGVFRAAGYLERLRRGTINATPSIDVQRVAHAALMVNADNAHGAVAGTHAMAEGIGLARQTGIALVSIRQSNHYGMAAYYVLQAIAEDMVAMAFTNSSPALPPWGGSRAFLGTSPLAVGIPGGRGLPFVLDMAMTVLARGNVYAAARHEESIPEGLALDKHGRPTTDPQELIDGGTMLPFGGVKGAALAMLMDILGGVFSGSGFGGAVANPLLEPGKQANVGHMFLIFRPDLTMPLHEFQDRMDALVERTKAQPRAAGVEEILIPGERELRCRSARLKNGIPLKPGTLDSLNGEAKKAGLHSRL